MAYKTMVIGYTTKTYLHLRILFSIELISGRKMRMIEKYKIEAIWPMMINGCSTG